MSDDGLTPYLRAQLAIVAAGVRPGWLKTGSSHVSPALSRAADELGLKHLVFEGEDELTVLFERRYSGVLFYDPDDVDPDDIAHLEKHGWGNPDDAALVGRVLGYDHPGCLRGGAQIDFMLSLFERHPSRKESVSSLFWYNVPRLNGATAERAARIAAEAAKAVRAINGFPINYDPIVLVAFRDNGS